MSGFNHAMILSPSFHSLRKERLGEWRPFAYKIWQKTLGGLPVKLGGGMRHASWNRYPISDEYLWFSLPYFKPKVLKPGAWQAYTVGVNIKRERVLSLNDE